MPAVCAHHIAVSVGTTCTLSGGTREVCRTHRCIIAAQIRKNHRFLWSFIAYAACALGTHILRFRGTFAQRRCSGADDLPLRHRGGRVEHPGAHARAADVLGGLIYAFWSRDEDWRELSTVTCFDPASGSWSSVSTLWAVIRVPRAVIWRPSCWVVVSMPRGRHGIDVYGQCSSSVGSWSPVAHMDTARANALVALIGARGRGRRRLRIEGPRPARWLPAPRGCVRW